MNVYPESMYEEVLEYYANFELTPMLVSVIISPDDLYKIIKRPSDTGS